MMVRIGVIGIGGMGSYHAGYLSRGEVADAVLAAVCDIDPARLEWARANLPAEVRRFESADALFASHAVDAVLIATPHYQHPPLAVAAFGHGLHVLSEKPAGVYARQVREMNEAAAASGRVFGVMFNQRTNPVYQKVRELISTGEIGEITRTTWIITDWFRTQSYYDSGSWRATWSGEGGGVLMNQAVHQMDLWQWICGVPARVRAFCGYGKYHRVEVEDDVTAYVEYENGATGIFATTTGEAPGTNRFEIAGDRGLIVLEKGKLGFWRLRTPRRQYIREAQGAYDQPECWRCDVPIQGVETGHAGITRAFVQAILGRGPLLAPGEEGIRSVQIINAMYLSAWTDAWAEVPVDEERFCRELQARIDASTFKKDGAAERILTRGGGTFGTR